MRGVAALRAGVLSALHHAAAVLDGVGRSISGDVIEVAQP